MEYLAASGTPGDGSAAGSITGFGMNAAIDRIAQTGATPLAVAMDGQVLGLASPRADGYPR